MKCLHIINRALVPSEAYLERISREAVGSLLARLGRGESVGAELDALFCELLS